MGGRGTIKFAVNFPQLFAAAAVLSAVPVPFDELRPGHPCLIMDTANPRMVQTIENAGGFEAYANSEENVWALIDQLAPTGDLPSLICVLSLIHISFM